MMALSPARRAAPLLLLALALAGCSEAPVPVGGAVGSTLPDFAVTTLDGDSLHLADLRGQVVLLNLWATWCPPCREEMPGLEQISRELGPRGLRVVGLSVDAPGDDGLVRSFVAQNGITFTVLRDAADHSSEALHTTGIPQTYLVGTDGVIRRHWIGMIDPARVRGALADALSDAR